MFLLQLPLCTDRTLGHSHATSGFSPNGLCINAAAAHVHASLSNTQQLNLRIWFLHITKKLQCMPFMTTNIFRNFRLSGTLGEEYLSGCLLGFTVINSANNGYCLLLGFKQWTENTSYNDMLERTLLFLHGFAVISQNVTNFLLEMATTIKAWYPCQPFGLNKQLYWFTEMLGLVPVFSLCCC